MINICKYLQHNKSSLINEYLLSKNSKQNNRKKITANDKNLRQIVLDEMDKHGDDADLNQIDVSNVTDMSSLFANTNFCGDVSDWNVSNVLVMNSTFYGCSEFNCDLSGWDTSHVINMTGMFYECRSFNCDLSRWDVSEVIFMNDMFEWCENFNCDISKWYVSKVNGMRSMFHGCKKFNQDLSKWNVSKVTAYDHIFAICPIEKKYKPSFKKIIYLESTI